MYWRRPPNAMMWFLFSLVFLIYTVSVLFKNKEEEKRTYVDICKEQIFNYSSALTKVCGFVYRFFFKIMIILALTVSMFLLLKLK